MGVHQWMIVLLGGSMIIAGCADSDYQPQLGAHVDPVTELHELVEQHQFFEAYVKFVQLRPTLDRMDEGASGLEYQRLVAGAAGIGQKDWPRILESPKIPLELKLDLVREIDESASRDP